MHKPSLLLALLATGPALADEPPPPPTDPTPPPATTAAPADPTPPPATTAAPPTAPAAPFRSSFDDSDLGVQAAAPAGPHKPVLTVELTGAGGARANPYIQYQGWTLETGAPLGTRLEVDLVGIAIGYELTTMSNDQACGVGCFEGSFGSTRFQALDVGYRYRFSPLGPVRPFLNVSLGGVLANSGDWSMATNKTVKGGVARAGFGIEIPITPNFFASAAIAYRLMITENPLRNADADTANKVFANSGSTPTGDYAEDVHLISGYIGIGASL